jgi:hypothetical protein
MEGVTMKAGVIFTGSGPILVLTTYESLRDPKFIEKLSQKGIRKFIAQEVSIELCKEKYGTHFRVVKNDVKETDDLRVLDYDGHHIFLTIPFAEMGEPFKHEG